MWNSAKQLSAAQHSHRINEKSTTKYKSVWWKSTLRSCTHVQIHKTRKDQNWTDWRARTHSLVARIRTLTMAWIRNKIIIKLFYPLLCFVFHVFLFFVLLLLINQIRIEIIFRIHMPGQINQKRGIEKNKHTHNNNRSTKTHETKQQKHKTKIAGLVIHWVENYA